MGKVPFHLKLKFQIYDLNGKPEEQGVLDDWWAGSAGSYIEITAPSFGRLNDLRANTLPSDEARRSLYLVRQLLDSVRAPYGVVPAKGKLVLLKKIEGKTVMDCLSVEPESGVRPGYAYRMACVDEESKAIRIITEQNQIELRNRLGRFGSTRVALDVQVLLIGRPAITGHVETLEGFDPAHAPVVLDKPASPPASGPPSTPNVATTPGTVSGGELINKANVSFPAAAREHNIYGPVLLSVSIDDAGKVNSLFPIASTDPLLTAPALDAVKNWTWKPRLLNGKPIAITTLVTINFNHTGIDSWH